MQRFLLGVLLGLLVSSLVHQVLPRRAFFERSTSCRRERDASPRTKPPAPPACATRSRSHARVALIFSDGEAVTMPRGLLASVEKAQWVTVQPGLKPGCQEVGGECRARQKPCKVADPLPPARLKSLQERWAGGETVVLNSTGSKVCPGRRSELVVAARVTVDPPLAHPAYNCSNHARAVRLSVGPEGFVKKCTCFTNYAGDSCEKCSQGFREYPRCGILPYEPKVVKQQRRGPGDKCPEDLYKVECEVKNHPPAMLQPVHSNQPLTMVGCHVGTRPYGCEIEGGTTPIRSLVTLVNSAAYGLQVMLLFESVRVFAPDVPFVIGYDDQASLHSNLTKLLDQGCKLELMKIKRTQATWFNEKALLIKRVLQKHENVLWVDSDAFLVAPLGTMPNSPLANFGAAVHMPQGWGFGKLPMSFGAINTGVLFAVRGTKHLDAWMDTVKRFSIHRQKELARGMHELFLDQQPMDFSLINGKGGFILDPAWNVAWWVDEGKVQKSIAGASFYHMDAYLRFKDDVLRLSPGHDTILFHGVPAQIIHSHFVASEKHNRRTNQDFNTHVFHLIQNAAPGTLLHKFAPRLRRYGTHVKKPSPEGVGFAPEGFASTLKQWD